MGNRNPMTWGEWLFTVVVVAVCLAILAKWGGLW